MTVGRNSLVFALLFILTCCSPVLAAPRRVMVEELTSQTCGPCYSQNPAVQAMIASYGAQVASVKWHVWWPVPGDDWFYVINNAVVTNRVMVVYAGPSHAAPSLYIDGGPMTFIGTNEQQQINARLFTPSPLTITGTAVTHPTSVDVSVDVNIETATPAPAGGSNRIFVALIEKHVPTGTDITGTITSGSALVTGLPNMTNLLKGSIVCGVSGLPPCPSPQSSTPARIQKFDSPTQITLTRNATESGVRTLNFRSYNWETMHHDVFRTINHNDTPASTGDVLDMTIVGPQHFEFSLPLAAQPFPADWNPDEFAVVVWAQGIDAAGKSTEIYQTNEIIPSDVAAVEPQVSSVAMLGRSWPNPFTGSTSIPFSIEQAGAVDLSVYDVSGRLVNQVVRGERPAGTYTEHWDGRDALGAQANSGIYYFRLRTAGVDLTRRVVLIR